MLAPDISLTRLPRVIEDLKSFLEAETVKVRNGFANKGVDIEVSLHIGEDLTDEEFDEYTENVAEELTDRIAEKYNAKTYRVRVTNLDTGEINTALPTKNGTASAIAAIASAGESRDEVVDLLVRARNSLLEANDTLQDARILADRSVSKKVATDIQTLVIDSLDGESASLIEELRMLIKTLSTAALIYEE